MSEDYTVYPNLNWAQFEICNDNKTEAFEDMCRDLFICEYLKESKNPHSDHNNPGVEVVPILEPPRDDGQPQRYISFQAKYFENNINDANIIDSMNKAVEYYSGKLGVIFLFCNKVISKETKRYQKYINILSPANIDLELVTDSDILALLRKYSRVANYFFRDRKRFMAGANSLPNAVAFASGVSDENNAFKNDPQNLLLEELLKDKLQKCKDAICDLKFGILRSELELLERFKCEDSENKILFYRIILKAHEKKDFSGMISLLPEELKDEAYWLKSFEKNIRVLSIKEFIGLSSEMQILVLDLLFSAQHWDYIIDLSKGRDKISKEVIKAFDFHYGLSLFNNGEDDLAHEVLDKLFNQYQDQRFRLYDICVLLHKANSEFVYGVSVYEKTIKELLTQLDEIKMLVQDQIKANEPFIAMLEMQSCFNLGAKEKVYLDEAFKRYEKYSDATKANDEVRSLVGLCFEMAGDLEKAALLFSECTWRSNEILASRYLISLIYLKRFNEAAKAYDELDQSIKTERLKAINFLILYKLGNIDYKQQLQEEVDKCGQTLSDLFLIGLYVDDSTIFDEIILPKLESLIPEKLRQTDIHSKIGLIELLARNKKLDLLKATIESIQDINVINGFVTYEIYKCLFVFANKAWNQDREVKTELKKVEQIAEKFIDADIQKRYFLQIKLICVSANHMVFSMLKYSKELFEYTHDIQTAKNIVALFYEQNETNAKEYEPYLSMLKESNDSGNSMAVAFAMLKLGHFDDADYYAYKAIYDLDGKDDFEIYKSLFIYINLSSFRHKERPKKKTISYNMIVTLDSNGKHWLVALDSENGFGDKNNHSLGVDHIGRTDPVFVKLIGTGRKQVLKLRGKSYTVIDFESREFFLGKFVYQKIQEYSDEFKGFVRVISTENTDELIKQIQLLSDNKEHTKALLDAYNFVANPLGIPIDFLIYGDYKKYIDAQSFLLHGKNLAYYAGEPRTEFVVEAKYVPALSTLVLLASNGWLDTLDWLGNCIVIPESYMTFLENNMSYLLILKLFWWVH